MYQHESHRNFHAARKNNNGVYFDATPDEEQAVIRHVDQNYGLPGRVMDIEYNNSTYRITPLSSVPEPRLSGPEF